jgi:methylamine dehydrogenase accessory protein MauD
MDAPPEGDHLSTLYLSQALLGVIILGLCAVTAGLARQIGILHERVAPVGALMTGGGPAVGAQAPRLVANRIDGGTLEIGGPLTSGTGRLLLFISARCPICRKVIPLAKSVAKTEQLELVFVGDAEIREQEVLIRKYELEGFTFLNGPSVGTTFQVGKLPYAVLLDRTGRISAKGLVNSREHLESLVVAQSSGFSSVQAYIDHAVASGNLQTDQPALRRAP